MDVVEEIKQRLGVEDVVAQYVQLKRAGRNFKGLSPFTNEKTASLMVSPEKQIWHDFSSGKGGNIFSFVMEMEGLDFKQALEMLARQAGIDPSHYQNPKTSSFTKEKEILYQILDLSAKFYQVHLTKSTLAREYIFKQRKFTKAVTLEFRLGYSPNNGSALVNFLKKKGYDDKLIKLAGLGISRRNGFGDMFYERIMIPLADPMGKIIGFTARSLSSDPGVPKYINTPQTALYDKSRHIFGLNLAKDSIRSLKYAVLVEGNLDVIASHQVGVKQVVATAGTALTEFHLKGISRFANDVRLSFDQDEAGISATERAISLASKLGINLSIVTTTGAKDPDELIRINPDNWIKAIDKAEYGLDWLISYYQKQNNIFDGRGKREFSDSMLKVINGLSDEVEREHYLNKVSKIMDVSSEALKSKIKFNEEKKFSGKKIKTKSYSTAESIDIDQKKIQDHLLCIALYHPEFRQFLGPLIKEMMVDDQGTRLLTILQKDPASSYDSISKNQVISEYISILLLQYEQLYENLDTLELHYEASRLQAQLIHHYVRKQKQQISASLHESNTVDTNILLEKAKHLDSLLKLTKSSINDL
jgi:DNA primase